MESTRVFGAKLGFKLSIRSQANVLSSCKPFRFPPTSFPGKPPKLVPLKATTNTLACEDENNRQFKKMEPSEWGHQFIDAHVDVASGVGQPVMSWLAVFRNGICGQGRYQVGSANKEVLVERATIDTQAGHKDIVDLPVRGVVVKAKLCSTIEVAFLVGHEVVSNIRMG
ncbi:unnamed protein product [Eruca vesicaria subsp. sativa]|uniref:Uncharacterized protein n=1 Tax=Eruca vesicaria subsp. sativa TaxID=29727 RepID=A0ABC8KZ46_ERUVS|nr:unnamed protein product [Eruca vesicaria subsp. sativa]